MATLFYTLSILVLVAHWWPSTKAQSEGDVRLVGGSSENLGRVEVFFRDRWGTICDRNFAGAADTICHQLNHTRSSQGTSVGLMNKSLKERGEPQIEKVTGGAPIALRDVDCGPIYSNPLVTTHILQCDYLVVVEGSSECSHDDDLAVVCDIDSTEKAYNSEVRLVGGNASSNGTLEIYLHNKWGNACFKEFQMETAHTVCRQLGYTHAQHFSETNKGTARAVWLRDVTCKTSYPCLYNCFGKHKFNETACAYAVVQCSFEHDQVYGRDYFGNAVMCSLQRRYSKTPAYFVAILSVSSVFWVVSSAAIIVLAVCCSVKRCPCYKLKKKSSSTCAPIN